MWSQKKPRWNNNGGQWDNEDQSGFPNFTPSGSPHARFSASLLTGLSNNDKVASFTEQINSKHAVQATEDKKPLYKTNIQAGKPVVRFDGTDDIAVAPFSGYAFTQPYTVFLACGYTPGQTPDGVFTDGSGSRRFLCGEDGGKFGMFLGTAWVRATTDVDTVFKIITCIVNGASSSIRINGSEVGTGNPGSNDVDVNFYIGSNFGETDHAPCDIGEIVIYNSLESVTANEASLMAAYNIT
jgi:hypothetical protein